VSPDSPIRTAPDGEADRQLLLASTLTANAAIAITAIPDFNLSGKHALIVSFICG